MNSFYIFCLGCLISLSICTDTYSQTCPSITANTNGGTFGNAIIQFDLTGLGWTSCGGSVLSVTYGYTVGSCNQEKFQQEAGAANCGSGGGKEKLLYTGCDNSFCSDGTGGVRETLVITINQTNPAQSLTCTYKLDDPSVTAPNCDYTLPITLVDFVAYWVEDEEVLLQWQTASETDNSYFTIERSTDGIIFLEVDEVQGAGDSDILREYSYTDRDLWEADILYYRLKQTDYDGSFSYSPVVRVNTSYSQTDLGLLLYPNPSSSGHHSKLRYYLPTVTQGFLTIYNQIGMEVWSESIPSTTAGWHTENLPKGLANGLYTINLTNAKTNQSQTLRWLIVD